MRTAFEPGVPVRPFDGQRGPGSTIGGQLRDGACLAFSETDLETATRSLLRHWKTAVGGLRASPPRTWDIPTHRMERR